MRLKNKMMIELTLRANYDKIWINSNFIIWMEPYDQGTFVYVKGNDSFDVVENITEIRKKISLC